MKNKKLWIFAIIVIAILILDRIFGWSVWLGNRENLSFLSEIVNDNLPLAILIYTAVTIVSCVILALPGVTFAIIAGLIFGPFLGTICCSVATTLGAMLAFIVGRFFLKDSIKPTAEKNKYLKKWLFDESGKNELFVLMITRLVPLFPYNLQNFAYGVTDISFATYSLGSLIFMLPGTAMYTIGFAGLADKEHRWLYFGIALLLAAAVFRMSAVLKRKYVGTEDETGGETGTHEASARSEDTSDIIIPDTSACIHCRECRDHCAFLSKHGLDIGDTERLSRLAYHCFLCGMCTSVCPAGIDGRDLVMKLRQQRTAGGTSGTDGSSYRMLLWEKKDYKYRNYRHATAGTVMFPGCNFTSMYPKTTKTLADLLLKEAGIGTVYDCCGKPVAELGLKDEEGRMIREMDRRFAELGIAEIVTMCPNCYDYLKERTGVKVVSIYEKLHELGLGCRIEGGCRIFMPCPDRYNGNLLSQIEEWFADEKFERIEGVQCCGLGGSGGVKEPEIAKGLTEQLKSGKDEDSKDLFVYCASCAGKLTRDGIPEVRHVLTEIMGTCEKPDTGRSMVNRMLSKFR